MNILSANYVIDHKGITNSDPWLIDYKNQYFKLKTGNVCTVFGTSPNYI